MPTIEPCVSRVLEDQQEVTNMLLQGSWKPGGPTSGGCPSHHTSPESSGSLKENVLEKHVEGVVEPKHSEELESQGGLGRKLQIVNKAPGSLARKPKLKTKKRWWRRVERQKSFPYPKGPRWKTPTPRFCTKRSHPCGARKTSPLPLGKMRLKSWMEAHLKVLSKISQG
ncbi:hypothetical protein E2320_022817 [Naja naja]|nr:hypothetical protein E2320_022817 [Naja naja]